MATKKLSVPALSGAQLLQAQAVLAVVSSVLRTLAGEDEDPSPLASTIAEDVPGASSAAVELAQDLVLLAADIVDAVKVNLAAPLMIPLAILGVAIGAVGELISDAGALPKK